MKHLTVDEMIDFVSFDGLDSETLQFAAKVQSHLLACKACREKVAAYQEIYDELLRLGRSEEFKESVHRPAREDRAVQQAAMNDDLSSMK